MPGPTNALIDAAAIRFDGSRPARSRQDHRVPRPRGAACGHVGARTPDARPRSCSSSAGWTRRGVHRSSSPRCTTSRASCSRSPSIPRSPRPGPHPADEGPAGRGEARLQRLGRDARRAREQQGAGSDRGAQPRLLHLHRPPVGPGGRRRFAAGGARSGRQPAGRRPRVAPRARVRPGRRRVRRRRRPVADRRLDRHRPRHRVPAGGILGRLLPLGAGASPQPSRCDHRRADRSRQPPQAVRRHRAHGRFARPRRDDHPRHLRPRRIQGLQRHVRPSRRRRAAGRLAGRFESPSATAAVPTASAATSSSSSRRSRRRTAARRRPAGVERGGPRILDRLLARLDAHPHRRHARAGAPRG